MNVRPLNDRVLVKRIVMPVSQGVIVTPQCAEEPSTWGRVMAVGPGRKTKTGNRIACEVRVGDVILFGKYTDFDQDDFVMIQEADIRGVVAEA